MNLHPHVETNEDIMRGKEHKLDTAISDLPTAKALLKNDTPGPGQLNRQWESSPRNVHVQPHAEMRNEEGTLNLDKTISDARAYEFSLTSDGLDVTNAESTDPVKVIVKENWFRTNPVQFKKLTTFRPGQGTLQVPREAYRIPAPVREQSPNQPYHDLGEGVCADIHGTDLEGFHLNGTIGKVKNAFHCERLCTQLAAHCQAYLWSGGAGKSCFHYHGESFRLGFGKKGWGHCMVRSEFVGGPPGLPRSAFA